MQEHPNVTLVRDLFAAMDRGDMQWVEDHTSDDIVWHTGGNSRAAGVRRGKDAVRESMATMAGAGTMKADVHAVIGDDDHTVVLGTAVVTAPSGKSVEYNYVNVFHIADGKVTEAWGLAENDAETDPIWDEFAT
ncbi:MAG TPA: nuclear transport factor 2 family protein [Actinomycetota bacterium]|nr:nuclear transport factor 2 family protein [Actinomycetota bacterium]